jgi:hypothetical protein
LYLLVVYHCNDWSLNYLKTWCHDVVFFLKRVDLFHPQDAMGDVFFLIHSFTIPIVFGELNEQIYFISVRCFSFFPSGS